jgi:hypothetical protein
MKHMPQHPDISQQQVAAPQPPDRQAAPVQHRSQEFSSPATLPNGPAAAALVAAGVGCLALGLFVILAEASGVAKAIMTLHAGVGALSGKTIFAVGVWLIAWASLYGLWRNKQVNFTRATLATLLLIGLGVLGTFPPVFMLFAH